MKFLEVLILGPGSIAVVALGLWMIGKLVEKGGF